MGFSSEALTAVGRGMICVSDPLVMDPETELEVVVVDVM